MAALGSVRVLVYFPAVLCLFFLISVESNYVIDGISGAGRAYDGIGGLSGGGSTSKLLVSYREDVRNQILDYLFKPNFGASLQILKVEIGGDSQSTDGTESSHQHEEWDENYQRGYEWWLMLEAKKRNPDIKLYGLPWAFPGWIGKGTPYTDATRTADYVTRWVNAAKKIYGLHMDYIGIWNERIYNITYIKTLRTSLDKAGFHNTSIVAADGSWGIAQDILKDKDLAAAVDIIGTHYPGTKSTSEAVQTKLKLWASEDYSTLNDNVGAGCWARILNQNFVNGNMTSTISWNLIAAYYYNLPFGRDGLMTAMEPWSGHYVVESPIWITAHTTQFTNIGWVYLMQGKGSGLLDKGGSYVSLISPDKSQFTMVIETMSHNHSICIRPPLPAFNVSSQTASFKMSGSLAKITELNVWYSKLGFDGMPTSMFTKKESVKVVGGTFSISLGVDEIYTLTTMSSGVKGSFGPPPLSKPFPLPYFDDYERYYENQEAANFAPQVGVWEVHSTNDVLHGKVNRQMILNKPVTWCPPKYEQLINLGGNFNWSDIAVQSDIFIPSVNGTDGAFLATRVDRGGCSSNDAKGLFFSVYLKTQRFTLALDLSGNNVVVQGDSPIIIKNDSWHKLTLVSRGNDIRGLIDTTEVFFVTLKSSSSHGFAAMGTTSWGLADFDNFLVEDAH